MRKPLAVLFGLSLTTAAAAAPQITLTQVSAAELTLQITTLDEAATLTTSTWNGQTFTRLGGDDGHGAYPPGSPDVPVLRRLIAIDPELTYEMQVTLASPVVTTHVLLAPVQPDQIDDGRERSFSYDDSAYQVDQQVGSEALNLGRPQRLGPTTVLPVTLTPYQYNPVRHELTVWRSVTAKIHAHGTHAPRLVAAGAMLTPFMAAQISALVENGAQVLATTALVKHPRHLLLATAELMPAATLLVQQTLLGPERMELVRVPKKATPAVIKELIASHYRRGDVDSVLLFGDQSMIPFYQWDVDTPGDWYYALLEDSSYGVVGLGRLPVHSADTAFTVIAKQRKYEQLRRRGYINPRALLVAHREGYPQDYTANQETVRHAPNPIGLKFATQYAGDMATDQTAVDEMNRGYGIISYRGHGDKQLGWWEWDRDARSFGSDEVHKLTNDDEGLSVFFSIACETGALGQPEPSLAEELLFYRGRGDPAHGAVAVLASTVDSYTDMNNTLNLYLFRELEGPKALDLGTLVGVANNHLVRDTGGQVPPNVEMYVLYGNPRLKPWVR